SNLYIPAMVFYEYRFLPYNFLFHKKVIVTTIDTIGMHLHKIPVPELRALLRGFIRIYAFLLGFMRFSWIFEDFPGKD
ncbi:MAG: hypothetical protein ACP5GN_08260, partial [Fervidicoccaceae archaeon]